VSSAGEVGGQGEVEVGEEDVGEAILGVLQNHYLAAAPADLPLVVLTQVMLDNVQEDATAALTNLLQRRRSLLPTDRSTSQPKVTVVVRSSAVKQSPRQRKVKVANDASKRVKRTMETVVKHLGADRDRRAMQLAVVNAQAQAQRIADSRQGWLRASNDLQTLLALPSDVSPNRIECYDISHPMGSQTVASQVVFIKGVAAKHLYRSYNIL